MQPIALKRTFFEEIQKKIGEMILWNGTGGEWDRREKKGAEGGFVTRH